MREKWERTLDGAIFFGLGVAVVSVIVWLFVLATN